MWDAFTGLCDIGAVVRPQNIFKVTPEILASLTLAASSHEANEPNPFVSNQDDPFNTGLSLGGSSLFSKLNGSMPPSTLSYRDAETPTSSNAQNIPDDEMMMGETGNTGGPVRNELTNAPGRKSRLQTHKRTNSGHSAAVAADPTVPAAPPRRSTRLQSHTHSMISGIRSLGSRNQAAMGRETETTADRRELRKVRATGTKGKTSTVGNVGRVVSGNRKPMVDPSGEVTKPDLRPTSVVSMAPPPKMAIPADPPREREALDWILDLLFKIGSGYRYLSRFECAKAIEAFNQLPTAQRDTPWVLVQIGRAYSERSMWAEAEKVFLRVRERSPTYIEEMDIFSTVLWQQKKEIDLSYLARTLNNEDRLAPQSWVALGNAMSLERDHDQAIKCFTRATQLDPKFAYAYTLQGHEHISNEELDKAMLAFRHAISANKRHYNGWYGLGRVYEIQHKFDFAERHYRAAFNINPSNALLAMRIGLVSSILTKSTCCIQLIPPQVLERMKKMEASLTWYDTAIRLDPQSLQARMKKAHILLRTGAAKEALAEYLVVRDAQPEDATVHLYIGQTYKRLRNKREAVKYFTICISLDPIAQRHVKEEMESWDEVDDGGEWSSELEQ